MPNGAPWTDDLAREPAVRRLVRALSLSQRFHFYIVTCKAPVVVDAVLDVVVKGAAEARGGAPTIRYINPYARHGDFTQPMDPSTLIKDVMVDLHQEEDAGDSVISVLDATLASPDDDAAWERLFAWMNERRNAIVKAMPGELILFLPPRLDDTFKRAAPDFWSIRSGEYEVDALPPVESTVERATPPLDADETREMLYKGRDMEVAQLWLEAGNTALRNRKGDIALVAFERVQDVAAIMSLKEPQRSEHIEMAERAALGVGRSRLLMGDVEGAERAWRGARKGSSGGLEEQPWRSDQINPAARGAFEAPSRTYNVFISYAPGDERYVLELQRHLRALMGRGLRIRHGVDVRPGESWDRAIEKELQKAHLVLLMISPEFLRSERAEVEISRALQTAEERGTRVIPVLLRPAALKHVHDLARLQSVPTDGVPILKWSSRDAAWSDVAQAVFKVLTSRPSWRR